MNSQRGFTLLELMVTLTLGLIISAAAIQIFITSQRALNSQEGMMDLQSSALFGLGSMVREIRLANLNAAQPYMNDKTLYGGVVLTSQNLPTGQVTDDKVLTRGGIGSSNLVGQKSDQLVVQYKVIVPNQYDCQGNELNVGDYVIQRFFLRKDKNRNDPNEPLALACTAASYKPTQTSDIQGKLMGEGEVMISRVDHFSVMLGIAKDGMNSSCNAADSGNSIADGILDCFAYISISDYAALSAVDKPQIVSVKLGMLVRASRSTGKNKFFNKEQQYEVLQTKAKLKEDDRNDLYFRSVVSQVVALRNGFGIR